jgi:hypothetical protein
VRWAERRCKAVARSLQNDRPTSKGRIIAAL